MTVTLLPGTGNGKARSCATHPNVSRHWADPVAADLARELCCTPAYAEKRMREAAPIAAAVIRIMVSKGLIERAGKYKEAIDRAAEGREPPPDCEATWSLADFADTNEDRRQGEYERARRAYVQTPNTLNRTAYWKARKAFIEASREERLRLTGIIDLLLDEQRREEGIA